MKQLIYKILSKLHMRTKCDCCLCDFDKKYNEFVENNKEYLDDVKSHIIARSVHVKSSPPKYLPNQEASQQQH